MSVALMAAYPEMFDAGAILAGGPFLSTVNPISGMSSMLHQKDMTVLEWRNKVKKQYPYYQGKYQRMIIIHSLKETLVNFENAIQFVKQWSSLLETDSIPNQKIPSFENHPDLEKDIYSDKEGREAKFFCRKILVIT